MYKRLKIQIYPTIRQKETLDRHFDAYRFAYNLCLEYKSTLWRDHKKNVSGFDMQKEIFEIRKEVEWLSKCKAECVREAAFQVDRSYKNFFKGKGFPKFKSERNLQSFTAHQSITIKSNRLSFFGNKIRLKTSEHYQNLLESHKIKQCTFKRDLTGKYWASCLIDITDCKVLPETNNVIGIDLGIKDLVITSEGEVFENKKFLQNNYYKLRRLQRKHAKSKKGGKNREKLRIKIARLSQKITNQKTHYYHQITNQLLSENQTIVMETLSVKNMLEEKKLSRQISDASWGLLTSMLEYKAKWYGRELIKIDKWFPSSKTCSDCGCVKETLSLSERIYSCECCEVKLDRDLNAAINIRKEGLKIPRLPVEEKDVSPSIETGNKRLKRTKVITIKQI